MFPRGTDKLNGAELQRTRLTTMDAPAAPADRLGSLLNPTLDGDELDRTLSRLLTEGGDDRLHLNAAGVNKYHCAPVPSAASVIERGSCTCSPPSPAGFAAARDLLRRLARGTVHFDAAMADLAARVPRALGISAAHEIVLTPSGSDAELLPLAVAAARAERLGCSSILSVVAAAGEVGSGTAAAAGGRHFSAFVPSGACVKPGASVAGFAPLVEVVELRARGAGGARVADYDARVLAAVGGAVRDPRVFAVVHAVDGSKTGLRVPGRSLLRELRALLGPRLLVVLDACQMRSGPAEVDWFLRAGAPVLVTGSKFFAGPGFCGAVLLPPDVARALDGWAGIPAGVADYVSRAEVPRAMPGLRERLRDGPRNEGLLLRWMCAVEEMELFARDRPAAGEAVRAWVRGVRGLVGKRAPRLALPKEPAEGEERDETRIGGINSVVSIKVQAMCGTRFLDAVALKKVHRLLTVDASGELPMAASRRERESAALRCTVGQPVDLGEFGVLRLAIGAPLARHIVAHGVERSLGDDERVLEKMEVLASYFGEM